MNIGNTYTDERIYRGIKHSNNLPLVAEDLHEFSDTMHAKNKHLLDNIVGSGILNRIVPQLTDTGLKLQEPAVLNVSGDICLIQTSNGIDLASLEDLKKYASGTLVIIGWYQNITANDTMKEYGGVINSVIENNLLYEPLNIQVSSRYQFRWCPVVIEGSAVLGSTVTFQSRDAAGELLDSSHEITLGEESGYMYIAEKPEDMEYSVESLYCIPLVEYTYDSTNDVFTSLTSCPIRQTSTILLESDTEPQGVYPKGTIWYNPVNREFHTYIEGTGFVSHTKQVGILQYRYVHRENTDDYAETPRNLTYLIDEDSVPELLESDIVHVTYEGLELLQGTDYSLDISNRRITLLNFVRLRNEKLVVTVTRIVEANNVSSITETLVAHMNKTANAVDAGHLKLSDSINSNSGVLDGIAATPKAVRDSHILTDTVTGIHYKLVVTNREISLIEIQ